MNIKQLKKTLKESSWKLGICLNGFDDLKNDNIHWVHNGIYEGKKWFADPFILDYDSNAIELLVEEFDYKIHRGRIAHITIDRSNWTVVSCKIILDLPTHLSFPSIYRIDGKVYVCPENYSSGAHHLYAYNQEKGHLEFVKTIIRERLTDATIMQIHKDWYIFSTYAPTPNGNKLTIYKGDKFEGPYCINQEVVFDEQIARNAGQIFEYNGTLIRPAQESYTVYGHSMVFQEIEFIGGNQFKFNEVYRYLSTHPRFNVGAHTFNIYNNIAVIDVKGYRFNLIGKILCQLELFLCHLGVKKQYIFK